MDGEQEIGDGAERGLRDVPVDRRQLELARADEIRRKGDEALQRRRARQQAAPNKMAEAQVVVSDLGGFMAGEAAKCVWGVAVGLFQAVVIVGKLVLARPK